jgi:hypothetical protein
MQFVQVLPMIRCYYFDLGFEFVLPSFEVKQPGSEDCRISEQDAFEGPINDPLTRIVEKLFNSFHNFLKLQMCANTVSVRDDA